ncbi:MAG: RHS repeat-associated core domain-containing protein [Pirellulales bacterium]
MSLLDPVGNETSWAYDALNRVTMETNELSATRSFYYDGANNLTRRIDRNGRTLQFAYDELNRQISEQWREDAAPAPEMAIAATTQGGATSEVQRVGFTAMMIAGGSFTLTHNGQTTSNLAWNASAADVKSALEALSGVGSGNVAVTKLSNATNRQEWQVTFQGSLAGTNVAQTTVATGSLTTMGGGPTAIQATDTQGGTNDEVQTVTLSNATDGVFRLAFGGQVTPPLDFAATAGDVETALEDLPTIDAVAVTGSAGGPWTVTFQGSLAGLNVASLQGDTANLLGGDSLRTISYVYDDAGQLTSVADPDSAYAYTYDALGRVTEVDNDGTPDAPHVVLAMTYDAASRRSGLSATIDATADFANTYSYDNLGRLTRVDQLGQTGGNSVAAKRVDFTYNALGEFATITRQTKPSSTWNEVATSTYTYDTLNRLTALDHTQGATDLNNYTWTYDDLNSSWGVTSSLVGSVSSNPIVSALATGAIFMGGGRIVEMTSVDGTSTYSYDATSQLTGADHDYQSDESYSYDANGNRTMSGYDTGDNNQLLEDGTYSYEYDDEGNRTLRTNLTTSETTEYEWDYRNRLTRVTDKDAYGSTTQVVAYTYDAFNRRIARAVDTTSPFDLGDAAIERYILDDANGVMSLDGGNVILDFVDPDGPDGMTDLSLSKRYLYGPAVDQVLAQEDVAESLGDDARVLWPLGDHLQTTRDLADQTGAIAEHYEYDSYGNVTSGDTSLTRHLFTAREFDEATWMQYSRARCYDAGVGRWVSEDPIGFFGRHANASTYIHNQAVLQTDPTGLIDYREYNPDGAAVPVYSEPHPSGTGVYYWWPAGTGRDIMAYYVDNNPNWPIGPPVNIGERESLWAQIYNLYNLPPAGRNLTTLEQGISQLFIANSPIGYRVDNSLLSTHLETIEVVDTSSPRYSPPSTIDGMLIGSANSQGYAITLSNIYATGGISPNSNLPLIVHECVHSVEQQDNRLWYSSYVWNSAGDSVSEFLGHGFGMSPDAVYRNLPQEVRAYAMESTVVEVLGYYPQIVPMLERGLEPTIEFPELPLVIRNTYLWHVLTY